MTILPGTQQQTWRRWTIAGMLLVLGVVSLSLWTPLKAQEKVTLSDFMRKKLDASSKILEGLAVEDETLIAKGADTLLDMSKAEMWNVLVDADYREFNRDFRSSVHKLEAAAKQKNFDNAALQWFDTVKACVECHKYVRIQRPSTKK